MPSHVRRVTISRIHDVPVTAHEFVNQGQDRITEQSDSRHRSDQLEVKEAVALGIIRFTRQYGIDKPVSSRGSI